MGIISCLGNDLSSVESALRENRSGLRYIPEYAALGLRSCVAGIPDISKLPPINRKIRRFMADAAVYAYYATQQALSDSRLDNASIVSPRTGLIVGSGVGSPFEHTIAMDTLRSDGLSKILPYAVPRIMGSTTSACLSTAFGIQGFSCSMTSACATSAHCIGYGTELIQFGKQDIVIVGGAEEVCWTTTTPFDAMGALSSAYNDATASRPYDLNRDGFVIAGGAGILVLEELEHALNRGAHIYAEITGFGASSDGQDMVTPSAEGAVRAMRLALEEADASIDYINTHATSTQAGDITELNAIRAVFGDEIPLISSVKGLSGHPIAAAGVHEAIYSMLMLNSEFLAGCANLKEPDPAIAGMPILTSNIDQRIDTVMSNSFGFGGTNVSLVFQRYG
ncbi:3-oxoacyl-[acyl-carrier-protein] synthase I [Methylophilaceae bacterium]|nr:3-oxoacyl-[acyl-carrier-protein] synthase I [Methylophilaceae bacterium]